MILLFTFTVTFNYRLLIYRWWWKRCIGSSRKKEITAYVHTLWHMLPMPKERNKFKQWCIQQYDECHWLSQEAHALWGMHIRHEQEENVVVSLISIPPPAQKTSLNIVMSFITWNLVGAPSLKNNFHVVWISCLSLCCIFKWQHYSRYSFIKILQNLE